MRRALQTAASAQPGLFGHPNLRAPSDWENVVSKAIQGYALFSLLWFYIVSGRVFTVSR